MLGPVSFSYFLSFSFVFIVRFILYRLLQLFSVVDLSSIICLHLISHVFICASSYFSPSQYFSRQVTTPITCSLFYQSHLQPLYSSAHLTHQLSVITSQSTTSSLYLILTAFLFRLKYC